MDRVRRRESPRRPARAGARPQRRLPSRRRGGDGPGSARRPRAARGPSRSRCVASPPNCSGCRAPTNPNRTRRPSTPRPTCRASRSMALRLTTTAPALALRRGADGVRRPAGGRARDCRQRGSRPLTVARVDAEVLVIGAGPAGLAVAACLRAGESTPWSSIAAKPWVRPGESRYDRLHLHTPRVQSVPARTAHSRSFRTVGAKDDMAEYLAPTRGASGSRRGSRPRCGGSTMTDGCGTRPRRRRALDSRGRSSIATGYSSSPVQPRTGRARRDSGARCCTRRSTGTPGPTPDATCSSSGRATPAPRSRPIWREGGAATVRLAIRTPPNIVPRQLGPVPTTTAVDRDGVLPGMARRPRQPTAAARRARRPDTVRHARRDARESSRRRVRRASRRRSMSVSSSPCARGGYCPSRRSSGSTAARSCSRTAPESRRMPSSPRPATRRVSCPSSGHLGVLDERGKPLVTGPRTSADRAGTAVHRTLQPAEGSAVPDQARMRGRRRGRSRRSFGLADRCAAPLAQNLDRDGERQREHAPHRARRREDAVREVLDGPVGRERSVQREPDPPRDQEERSAARATTPRAPRSGSSRSGADSGRLRRSHRTAQIARMARPSADEPCWSHLYPVSGPHCSSSSGTICTPHRPSCVNRSHTMCVRMPIASEAISSSDARDDTTSAAGARRRSRASRAARAGAPRSHASGRRRASRSGDSSRAAGRRTHRQTSSSARAITIVSGSHQRLCVRP